MRYGNNRIRIAGGALLFALVFATNSAVRAQGWSQWRGASRDGLAGGVVLPDVWPKSLKERWKVTVGVGHSSPVYANGKLYVFARQGEEEVLLSLDANSGKELWRSANPVAYQMNPAAVGHGKGPKSTPVISNNRIFTLGISGVLSAHDLQTGKVIWRKTFADQFPTTSPLYGTAMSPIVDGDLLIAHVGGHDKGALTAFDISSGAVKWTNPLDGPGYASPVVATLAGVRQLVTMTQKDVAGFDLTTGKLLWRLPAKSEYDTNSVTPVVYKDLVIVAREGQGLTAVRIVKRGADLAPEEVWSNKETELYMNTPVLAGDQLVGLSVRNKGQFFALNPNTGEILWRSPGRAGENAAIINAGGKALLLLTNDSNLIVLPVGAKDFSPLAQLTVADSPTWAHPLLSGPTIFIKDETTIRAVSL